jgi:hypothetical protein
MEPSPMASRLASLPPSVSALPFMLARARPNDLDWSVQAALAAAIAAERAVDGARRNTRARLCYLLCELGFQLDRRKVDRDQRLPILRGELADALATSLTRIKRTLALLALSGVVETDGTNVRIIAWRRLAGVAGYDPGRLGLSADGEDDWVLAEAIDDEPLPRLTPSGDPACFV